MKKLGGNWTFWGSMIAVFLLTWLLLWLEWGHVLQRCELLSLFLPTSIFFDECMTRPGGLIDWLATYFTQYLYHPWLGALLYAGMLVLLQWLVVKAFDISRQVAASAAIVPLMLLWGVTVLGYEIFSMRTPGIVFSPLVGCLLTAFLLWGVRLLKAYPILNAIYLCILPLLYPLIGAYALIATILAVVTDLCRFRQEGLPKIIIGSAVSLALVWFVPYWWIRHIAANISFSNLYLAALPMLNADEVSLWLPYAIAALYLVVAATGALCHVHMRYVSYLSVCAALAAMVCAASLSNHDANFHATVKMELALDNQDYLTASKVAQNLDVEPTRLNVLLAHVALNNMGCAGDFMFTFPNGSAPYKTKRDLRALHDSGSYIISYNLGRINYAYRWAMEYLVEYGPRADYLKYMVRCALLNGEPALAKKHLDVLSQTRNHRSWARRYYQYLSEPQTMTNETEFRLIDPLTHFANQAMADNGLFERHLRPALAHGDVTTIDALDLALQNCLVNKEVSLFAERIGPFTAAVDQLPRHYQEALVLADHVQHSNVSNQYQIDPQVRDRFAEFVRLSDQYRTLPPAEQRRLMQPLFGNTYWYYFVYVKDLMMI